ncbi:MAG: OmpA family protein [Myxococcaceae bacterium]|nr:OmpA family protein [Myxococcaceae bacterium]MCI0673598.1 OmpA family protein [Myxococcaceae bacterium]
MGTFNIDTVGGSEWGRPEKPNKNENETGTKPRSTALPWTLFGLTLVALGAVLYFGQKLVSAEQTEAESARTAGRDLTDGLRKLEASNQTLQARVNELEAEKGTLSQSLAEKDAELAKLKATHDELQEKLEKELADGDVVLTNDGGRVQVDLVDKVLFASGDASLSPRGEEVLARIGSVLAKQEDRIILVSGHTDDSPISDRLRATYPSNWELSVTRAVNVVRFLSEKAGVPAKRLVAAGNSQFRPVATNANHKGRARNRRIELLLMPDLEARKAELATPAKGEAAGQVKPAKGAAPARR